MHDASTLTARFARIRSGSLIAGLVALALAVVGFILNPAHFWRAYLLATMFWLEIGLGCLAMLMLHHLVGGRWSAGIRRLMETGAMTIPLMGLLFVPLLIGATSLYPWADPQEVANNTLLQQKTAYLNLPFFIVRAAIYFGVWSGLAYLLMRWSPAQGHSPGVDSTPRLRRLSAVGMILYVLTATFAAYDWMMSLEPEWFSSIYGLLWIAGQATAALALALVGLAFLARNGLVAQGWQQALNDLGNFLLAFVMIWAYLAFSQFLIIWSANIPEEAVWYVHRSQGGWLQTGSVLIAMHFALPFVLLLSRTVKRSLTWLVGLAILIFVARFVDLLWLIMPAFYPDGLHLHWLDLALWLAVGSGWVATFAYWARAKALLPRPEGSAK